MKRFAVFDIDGTLIRWQLYHAVADEFLELGFVSPSAYDSVKTARMQWKRRAAKNNFKTYEAELIRVYEEVLKNITTDQFEAAAKKVFGEYRDQTYIYTRQLIKELKAKDYLLFAISGSQTEIVELVARHYGFDDFLGTVYERDGQKFTGRSTFYGAKKDQALKTLVAKHFVDFKDSIGIGDSKSDAAMMRLVDQPIAFNPDKDLFECAKAANWKIVIERKNMVYELGSINGKYQLVKTN